MTDNVQELRLVKGKQDTASTVISAVVFVGLFYYSLKPDALERHRDAVGIYWRKVQHRISVWETLAAIRSLPEKRR